MTIPASCGHLLAHDLELPCYHNQYIWHAFPYMGGNLKRFQLKHSGGNRYFTVDPDCTEESFGRRGAFLEITEWEALPWLEKYMRNTPRKGKEPLPPELQFIELV